MFLLEVEEIKIRETSATGQEYEKIKVAEKANAYILN